MGNHSFSRRLCSATILDRFFFCHKSCFSMNFWATHRETTKKLGHHETPKKLSQSYMHWGRGSWGRGWRIFFCLSSFFSSFFVRLILSPYFLPVSISILDFSASPSLFSLSVCFYLFSLFLSVSIIFYIFFLSPTFPHFLFVSVCILIFCMFPSLYGNRQKMRINTETDRL